MACLFLATSESVLGALGDSEATPPIPSAPPLFPLVPSSRGHALCSSKSPCLTLHSQVGKASVCLLPLCFLIISRLLLRLLPASDHSQFLDLKALSSPGLYLNLLAI